MAVKLRLKRMGTKKKPYYRVVAADSIELVGTYNPITGEKSINEEIAIKWLSNGAIPTDTVRTIFRECKINEKFHNLKHEKEAK